MHTAPAAAGRHGRCQANQQSRNVDCRDDVNSSFSEHAIADAVFQVIDEKARDEVAICNGPANDGRQPPARSAALTKAKAIGVTLGDRS